jgi:eukaryotic-like serine/threonine-protein kinase
MPHLPGTRVGAYELIALLGAGGMGEVYRARDTRLQREVAIKVLPEIFAADPDRLARFAREAQVLATLNHAHIGQIYGIEESNDVRALVMELVEGETLADRIVRRPIPFDEALPIARQIADALEAAHDKGIIHRDLKPANIKLTSDAQVKVLDFGLAKLSDPNASINPSRGQRDSIALTTTSPAVMTHVGVLLGTAAYMSPEQARGRPVDKRTDVWAFGCVLFEMLTGRRAFEGDEVVDTLANVLTREPGWEALPATIPDPVQNLLRGCLEKDRAARVGDAAVMRYVLNGPESQVRTSRDATAKTSRAAVVGWAAAGILLAVSAVLAAIYYRQPPMDVPLLTSAVALPEGTDANGEIALSPDGQRLAFSAAKAGEASQLWVRSLGTAATQPLSGTAGAHFPFWSPDSRSIGFFADQKVKRIDVAGGPAVTIADAQNGRGASWSPSGVIVFNPVQNAPLMVVSDRGGGARRLTTLRPGENSHRLPWFLPDGQHFLYSATKGPNTSRSTLHIGDLQSTDDIALGDAESNAIYVSTSGAGQLLFMRQTTLMAQPFDTARLATTGPAAALVEDVRRILVSAYGQFTAAGPLLLYRGGGIPSQSLVWVDRNNMPRATLGDAAAIGGIELSPDGARAAVELVDPATSNADIWIVDVAKQIRTRLTFDPGEDCCAIWSADGQRIVFSSNRTGRRQLYVKPADGSGEDSLLYTSDVDKTPASWASSGRALLFRSFRASTDTLNTRSNTVMLALPLRPDGFVAGRPVPFPAENVTVTTARFSPDGRWVAYASADSGRLEVYLSPFPGPGGRFQVSADGGSFPRWRHDGREIFFLGSNAHVMAADVTTHERSAETGTPRQLVRIVAAPVGGGYAYDVAPDGQRFLVISDVTNRPQEPVTLVQGWPAMLRRN